MRKEKQNTCRWTFAETIIQYNRILGDYKVVNHLIVGAFLLASTLKAEHAPSSAAVANYFPSDDLLMEDEGPECSSSVPSAGVNSSEQTCKPPSHLKTETENTSRNYPVCSSRHVLPTLASRLYFEIQFLGYARALYPASSSKPGDWVPKNGGLLTSAHKPLISSRPPKPRDQSGKSSPQKLFRSDSSVHVRRRPHSTGCQSFEKLHSCLNKPPIVNGLPFRVHADNTQALTVGSILHLQRVADSLKVDSNSVISLHKHFGNRSEEILSTQTKKAREWQTHLGVLDQNNPKASANMKQALYHLKGYSFVANAGETPSLLQAVESNFDRLPSLKYDLGGVKCISNVLTKEAQEAERKSHNSFVLSHEVPHNHVKCNQCCGKISKRLSRNLVEENFLGVGMRKPLSKLEKRKQHKNPSEWGLTIHWCRNIPADGWQESQVLFHVRDGRDLVNEANLHWI
eukprot:Filipodium_phascolosomae@DN2273_c0_g1_i2.p1